MKQLILDTNICIELLNGNEQTIKKLSKYSVICVPIIVCGELLFGAKNSKRSKANEKKFKIFIDSCVVLNTNSLVAKEYASIRKYLKDNGTPIPENDIWIAAICKVNDIPLATKDKHFKNITGISLAKF